MTKGGPHHLVRYRREREGRTDYHYRRKLLRSGKPRLVVRVSLKHIRAQIAKPTEEGDEVLTSAFSKELSNLGWKGYTANLPSAYLVGYLCGLRAQEKGIDECILDMDRFVSSPQAKVFGVLKGALEAGLEVPHNEKVLPTDDRHRGEHISDYAEDLKSDEEKYKSQFSNYLDNNLEPENLPGHFKEVKEAIANQIGE